jgi:serine/threonine protein phosphatase PrpC
MKQPLRMQRRFVCSGLLALCLALGLLFTLATPTGAAGPSASGASAFSVPTQEGVALAQIATVRVVAHYTLTYSFPTNPSKFSTTPGTCTGLGVLVQSPGPAGTPSDAAYLLTSSEVLASNLACPQISERALPLKATLEGSTFDGADIYLSRAYLGQTAAASPLFILPPGDSDLQQAPSTPQPVLVVLTPATGTLAHDYPTASLSLTPTPTRVLLDLLSSSNASLTNNQLNPGFGTPTPTPTSAGDFLSPTTTPVAATGTAGSIGAPVIDPGTGAVEGLLKSDGTVLSLASVTLPNTPNTCPGNPANQACLTAIWKAAMDAYYGPTHALGGQTKHDLSKLSALATNAAYGDFGGARDFLNAALALQPKPTPTSTPRSSSSGWLDLGNPNTALIIIGVLLALIIILVLLILVVWVRRLRRKGIQPESAAPSTFPTSKPKASGHLPPSYAAPPPAAAPAPFEAMPQNASRWQTIICPRCGTQNNPGSSTCFNCGLDLPQRVAGTSGAGRSFGRSSSGGPAPLSLPPLKPPPAPDVSEMPTHIFQLPGSAKADGEPTLPTMPAVGPGKQEEATVVMRGRSRAPLGVKVSSKTDPGRRRKDNEDNFLAVTGTWKHNGQLQPFGLFVIADGMGGHANGQDASRIAVESIYQHLAEVLPKQDAPDEALGGLLQEAIQRANQMIYQQNQKDHADMGCTMTAALVTGSEAHICNVGDSRTYLLNPHDHLQRVTTDHSIVESLVAAGVIQKDDVYTHPKRNQIYRSLGEKEAAEIDVFRQRLAPGDKLLLCCDGLWEMVRDPDIEQVLRHDDLPQVTSTLIEMANENGGVDNITAIVVKLIEDARPARQPMIQSVASGPANLDHPQR